jgi:secretion system chaperone SscA
MGEGQIQQLAEYFNQGITLNMLNDTPKSQMDVMYAYAWQCVDNNNFIAARNTFYLLTYLNHWDSDYLLGLGSCHQKLGEHSAAILCFSHAAQIVVSDPRPAWLAAQSYAALSLLSSQIKALETVISLAHTQQQWAALSQLAKQQLHALPALQEQNS